MHKLLVITWLRKILVALKYIAIIISVLLIFISLIDFFLFESYG